MYGKIVNLENRSAKIVLFLNKIGRFGGQKRWPKEAKMAISGAKTAVLTLPERQFLVLKATFEGALNGHFDTHKMVVSMLSKRQFSAKRGRSQTCNRPSAKPENALLRIRKIRFEQSRTAYLATEHRTLDVRERHT